MATFATFLTRRMGSRAVKQKKTTPSKEVLVVIEYFGRGKARIKTHGRYSWVETGVRCPACNKELSYDPEGAVECGGPGEGGCSASMLSYSLGTPKWQKECEDYKFITDEAKFPSLETLLKVQHAFDKAATIGEEIWAKRHAV